MKKRMRRLITVLAIVSLTPLSICAEGQNEERESHSEYGENSRSEHGSTEMNQNSKQSGEHLRENSEGGENEESGQRYTLDETYDFVRKGTRLILNYSREKNEFYGSIENITEGTLDNVRIEVHLSNSIEVGPTPPIDLKPGESRTVTLPGSNRSFTAWTPHAEVGKGEHVGYERDKSPESGQN